MENIAPNILVVEDNEIIAQGLKRILEKQHYTVDVATDGMAAMEMLLDNKYNLVMTDISMPHVTGTQLIQAIKRNGYDDVKIIVLTSFTHESAISEVLALGADDCLTKPFNTRDLLHRVSKLL